MAKSNSYRFTASQQNSSTCGFVMPITFTQTCRLSGPQLAPTNLKARGISVPISGEGPPILAKKIGL